MTKGEAKSATPIRTAITLPSRSRDRDGRNEGMPGAVVREEIVFTKLPVFIAPPASWVCVPSISPSSYLVITGLVPVIPIA
jgi:hypothetical protein